MGALLVVFAVITVLLKKSAYVEANELGVADTVLQIILTLSIGLFYMGFVDAIR